MPVIVILNPTSFTDYVRAFRQGLREIGYSEGDVAIEDRSGGGFQLDQLPQLTSRLIRGPLAVITVGSIAGARAVKAATTTIPIVFIIGDDPVKLGLVTSLARPGGNLTGVNFFSVERTPRSSSRSRTRSATPATT